MSDTRDTLRRGVGDFTPPPDGYRRVLERRDRKARNRRLGTFAVVALIVAGAVPFVQGFRSAPTPLDDDAPPRAIADVQRNVGEVLADEGYDLVALDTRTGAMRTVVDGRGVGGRIYHASWSADGAWIAFDAASGAELWITTSGREPHQLVDGDVNLVWAWSPSDPRLAATRGRNLWIFDAASGTETETDLGNTSGDVTNEPAWSPDGERVVVGARGGGLYAFDVRRGNVSLLVELPGELDSIDGIYWSPDGTHVAILADLDHGRRRLFLMNADGSEVRIVAEDFEPGGHGFGAWSPDGTRFGYMSHVPPGRDRLEIWTASVDGSAPYLVTSQTIDGCPAQGCALTWSPDGAQIAFGAAGEHFATASDGTDDVRPIDELMYLSWGDGSYVCEFCFG